MPIQFKFFVISVKNYEEAEVNYNQAKRLYENFFNDNHPDYVKVISKLSKVYYMQGDASKARNDLGWEPEVGFAELVEMMVEADLDLAKRERTLVDAGLMTSEWNDR